MNVFELEIQGDEGMLHVEVLHYDPGRPMVVTGWGFGDAEPPDPEEMDYVVTMNGEDYEPNLSEVRRIEEAIREWRP